MKVNLTTNKISINKINLNNFNTAKAFQYNYRNFNTLDKDTINFTSKKDFVSFPSVVQEGKNLGMKIYYDALESGVYSPLKFLKEASPDLEVLPIKQLQNCIQNSQYYAAFFTAQIDKDFNDTNPTIYIDEKLTLGDKNEMMLKAMEVAHEYTHYRQSKEGQEVEFLKGISSEWDYFGTLTSLSCAVFEKFDTKIQANMLMGVFNNMQDMESNGKYGKILPNKRNITKDELLKLSDFKDENEFRDEMNKIFDAQFENLLGYLSTTTNKLDPIMRTKIAEIIKNGDTEILKEDLRKYCAFDAKKEKEAYQTESVIAKEIMQTRKPINLDAFVLYYEMLEDALTK